MSLRNVVSLATVLVLVSATALAQKTKVGYDKAADFSRYKTYSLVKRPIPPAHPLAYASVMGVIEQELTQKGLKEVPDKGDLMLQYTTGVESQTAVSATTPVLPSYGGVPPTIDSTMWTGNLGAPGGGMSSFVTEGELALEFVDAAQNKVVWRGVLKERIDAEQKSKTLDRIEKGVAKLLKDFPPAAKP